MRRFHLYVFLAMLGTLVSCGTTNSSNMYDPNAPIQAIDISTTGSVDPASRTMTLPQGDDDLLLALKSALSSDGWVIGASTTDTRYMMNIQTKVWAHEQRLSYISLSIVDQKNGTEILSAERKMFSPNDVQIDVKAVADMIVSSLKKITPAPAD